MKRKLIFFSVVVAVVLMAVVPAQAIFCNKCGADNPDGSEYCISCGARLLHADKENIYDKSYELFSQEKYDQVISLLAGYCASNSSDFKSQLLLAEAYLEKCELIKETGSDYYKNIVIKPYEIGKAIHLYRNEYLSEALYVCGRSFHINGRSLRAIRYIKKAIKLSMSPPVKYFIALGDAQFGAAKREESQEPFENDYYPVAQKTYEDVLNMKIPNNLKAKVYYKLGVLHLYFNEKKDAKQAFESALKFADKDSLISRIHGKMNSL